MTDLATALRASSQRIGIDPLDLGTAISYETGGTFDPWQLGPTTKWGQHVGLIQMGEPQRAEYGYRRGDPLDQQMRAVEKYLVKAGVRPGHGLLDIYSAINAGGVGRYNRSDAAAGGAPGTVRDKVEQQMAGHRRKAAMLLGGGPTRAAAAMAAPPAADASVQTAQTAPIAQTPAMALANLMLPLADETPTPQRPVVRDDSLEQERRLALLDLLTTLR